MQNEWLQTVLPKSRAILLLVLCCLASSRKASFSLSSPISSPNFTAIVSWTVRMAFTVMFPMPNKDRPISLNATPKEKGAHLLSGCLERPEKPVHSPIAVFSEHFSPNQRHHHAPVRSCPSMS